MASLYGDTLLDSIMEEIRASQPQPNRPQFRITQTSSVLPNVDPAPGLRPLSAPATPTGLAYRMGRLLGRGARLLPTIAGADQLVGGVMDTATGGPTTANAIRSGVGAASLFSPPARMVALGMSGADLIPDAAYKAALGINDTDIRGPATLAYQARTPTPPAQTALPPVSVGVPAAGSIPAPAPATLPAVNAEEIIRRNYAPERGTGAISLNGGPAFALDARGREEVPAPAAAPSGLGGVTSALFRLKQVSGDNAQRVAQAKAATAAVAAGGTAARGAAALTTSNASLALARAHLEANPTDLAGAAAILHGRSAGEKSVQAFPGFTPNEPTTIVTPKGAVFSVKPTKRATEGDLQADMKARKLTREQVLAEYQRRGIDTAGLK